MGEGRNSSVGMAAMVSKLNLYCNKMSSVVFFCEHFRSEPHTNVAVLQRFGPTV